MQFESAERLPEQVGAPLLAAARRVEVGRAHKEAVETAVRSDDQGGVDRASCGVPRKVEYLLHIAARADGGEEVTIVRCRVEQAVRMS